MDYSNKKKEKEKFLEFHLMVGVLLLYQKRYEVLQYAFAFTNSYPPKYPLVPNTFTQIFDYYTNFPWSEEPFYLLKYNMFKNWEGANTEGRIEELLIDYLALLMVRLFSVNDYNITFSCPMAFPCKKSTIEENEHIINRAETIMQHLKKIPDDTINKLGLEPIWKKGAQNLLEDFRIECEKEKESLKTRRVVSEEKCRDIKQGLIEVSNKSKSFLPSSENTEKEYSDEVFLAELETKLPDELILDNHSHIWSDLEEQMVQGLRVQQRLLYCRKILQNVALRTYSISYGDFGEALKRLRLSSAYALVAIGVSSHLYNEVAGFSEEENHAPFYINTKGDIIKIYNIPSYPEDTILIMKDKDVPRFGFRDLEESEYDREECCEIESEKHLYSNIDNIKETNPVLKVKQGFYVNMPKPLMYVCIRILYRLEPDTTVVSNIEPIKNYMP